MASYLFATIVSVGYTQFSNRICWCQSKRPGKASTAYLRNNSCIQMRFVVKKRCCFVTCNGELFASLRLNNALLANLMTSFGTIRKDISWTGQKITQTTFIGLKVLVVGGTNGIGQSLTRELIAKGVEVIVVGRVFRE